ncbi:MAG: threonylcarbamoyl-AMP synthase [Candidatus Pacebacteria bacterium]|nr:threonylcarbamoyl-AMP synthase [Candidatus Paceibacterota bacterium]
MKILDLKTLPVDQVIQETVHVLSEGGLVVYPTETTYGIGVDATNQFAVDNLLKYKKRREGKPLSIAVFDEYMAAYYVQLNEKAREIYATFLPGPVTVVSTGRHVVAQGVESEVGTLGIRIPNYPLVLQIVKAFGKPITATGANASYKKRPYSIQDIFNHISERQKARIALVLDAGELPHNEPSTVIDTTLDDVMVLRQGKISFSEKNVKITKNAEETQILGKQLMSKYKNILTYKAIVFCLQGEMGAGKTQFAKGIAQALGVHQTVSSPTYTLSNEYVFEAEGKKTKFIHIDTWRLFNSKEFLELGFEHMIDACDVIVIEWAEKIEDVLHQFGDEAKLLWVMIDQGKKENERIIHVGDMAL